MRSATTVTASTFGAIAGLAGLEHGIGEVLQGNRPTEGMMVLSWPDSAWFRILGGEPAMTVVPNLLVTGILAILLSLTFLVWATMFVQRKNGGLVLILLSILMLLVGGGFGPPLLGIIVGLASSRINAPLTRLPARRFLGNLWPWSFAAALASWLMLMPGSMLWDYFLGVSDPELLLAVLLLSATGFLLLTILTAFARDSQQYAGSRQVPSAIGGRPGAAAGS